MPKKKKTEGPKKMSTAEKAIKRYGQKTHKLTPKLVRYIRSQEGKMSYRKICKEVYKMTHRACKIYPSTIHYIFANKIHKIKDDVEDKIYIYDLIEQAQMDENLDIDKLTRAEVEY